jgi:hypothetical protein
VMFEAVRKVGYAYAYPGEAGEESF